jgi:hypothetical protein
MLAPLSTPLQRPQPCPFPSSYLVRCRQRRAQVRPPLLRTTALIPQIPQARRHRRRALQSPYPHATRTRRSICCSGPTRRRGPRTPSARMDTQSGPNCLRSSSSSKSTTFSPLSWKGRAGTLQCLTHSNPQADTGRSQILQVCRSSKTCRNRTMKMMSCRIS